MKRSKFSVFGLLLLILSLVALVGCDDPHEYVNPSGFTDLNYADGTTLQMAVAHNNMQTTISFEDAGIVGEGLTLADGKTYQLGDLKPVWAELENVLNVKFDNVYSGANSAGNEYKVWNSTAVNFSGVDVVVGNASDITVDGRAGKIVDLSKYLELMPNFAKFLEDNPIVQLSVISDTTSGSIYYAPYFDGYDDIEKYFLMRTDWIETLLDGATDFTATTSDTFGDICGTAAYTPYMPTTGTVVVDSLNAAGTAVEPVTKNYGTTYGNIIDYMNKNVTASTTGVQLVNMFRDYIDAAYDGKYGNERSRLFTGNDACWDADELVALLRCVVCNTQGLTGQNTTKVTGLFPREKSLNRTSDLFSIASMFGVRGYESRNDYLYFNADGELCDARGTDEFNGAIGKLNELYKEGLILQNFDTYDGTIFRDMYQKNQGFMLYDYLQTQTIYNDDATTLAACADFNLTAVMNPVAKWYDGSSDEGTYMRFTESWRSTKTNGWCIPTTCTGDELKAALTLFDYAYSPEGQILMSYGPSAWRSGQTITYKGEQIPELSAAALNELKTYTGGNYTNYARRYLGSTLPIGFVKDQGMEYQCTSQGGREGAAKVSQAIALGTLKHVSPTISENLFYTMVPTVLPTTNNEDTLLAGNAALQGSGGVYSKANNQYNVYIDVIKNGYGSSVALSGSTYISALPADAAAMSTYFTSSSTGGSAYLYIQTNAWERILNYYNTVING